MGRLPRPTSLRRPLTFSAFSTGSVRLLGMKRAALVTITFLLLVLLGSIPANAKPRRGGNSANAKACNRGGWRLLATSSGRAFKNQGGCVSYAAHGGSLTIRGAGGPGGPGGGTELRFAPGASSIPASSFTYVGFGAVSQDPMAVAMTMPRSGILNNLAFAATPAMFFQSFSVTATVLVARGGGGFEATSISCTIKSPGTRPVQGEVCTDSTDSVPVGIGDLVTLRVTTGDSQPGLFVSAGLVLN